MIRFLLGRLVDLFRYLLRFISSFFRDTSDPVGDVLKFINSFERTYGNNHPEFYRGSYSQGRFVYTLHLKPLNTASLKGGEEEANLN